MTKDPVLVKKNGPADVMSDFLSILAKRIEDSESSKVTQIKREALNALLQDFNEKWPGFSSERSTPTLKLSLIISIDVDSICPRSKALEFMNYRESLIKDGVNVNHIYGRSGSLLDIAIKHDNPEAAIWLAGKGAYLTEEASHFFLSQLSRNCQLALNSSLIFNLEDFLESNQILIRAAMKSKADEFNNFICENGLHMAANALSKYLGMLNSMQLVNKNKETSLSNIKAIELAKSATPQQLIKNDNFVFKLKLSSLCQNEIENNLPNLTILKLIPIAYCKHLPNALSQGSIDKVNSFIQDNFFRIFGVSKLKNPFLYLEPEISNDTQRRPALPDDTVKQIINHVNLLDWLETPLVSPCSRPIDDLSFAQKCEVGIAGFVETVSEECSIQ